ncbi:transcriptional regulator [Paenibacillus sp. CAA11]|nr:transcriptional regulator [Paenibacillus sp. CAA11]
MKHAPTIISELEAYIRQEGMTSAQFAASSEIHPRTLNNLILGHRPIAVQQLDRITKGMGLPDGYYYDLYIENYIIDRSPDWRRVGPLIIRCAELHKLDAIQRVVQHVMDKLMYSPMLFDTAEELFSQGYRAAALLLYETVAEGEKFQHSERLALCQYRLFTLRLGDDQEENYQAAIRFEPFVERLDLVDQLDALKELINTYRSLQRWNKVNELAHKMGYTAQILYNLKDQNKPILSDPDKKLARPLFFYIAYSNLLKGNVCDEQGDYEQALSYKHAYANLDWVKEKGEDIDYWKDKFREWSEANICITKLLSGDLSVIESYTAYINENKEELTIGLLYILRAANKHQFNVDKVLQKLEVPSEYGMDTSIKSGYSRKLFMDRQAHLMYELAYYHLSKERYDNGFKFLLNSLQSSVIIRNEKHMLDCVKLYEKHRTFAHPDTQDRYQKLLLRGEE